MAPPVGGADCFLLLLPFDPVSEAVMTSGLAGSPPDPGATTLLFARCLRTFRPRMLACTFEAATSCSEDENADRMAGLVETGLRESLPR